MSKELVRIEPAFEAEIVETRGEAAYMDFGDATPDCAAVSTPLGEAEEEALELGIATVFESLMAESGDAGEGDPTFALLAELNRLWSAPLAA